MLNKNIENFIACDCDYENADIVLFGAPFDSTTSYRPGTRFASRAIRGESYSIETYSPYLDKDLCDIKVFDSGDLELCFGSSELALSDIEKRADTIISDGKIPFMLGGEHLVTLGAVRAAAKHFDDLYIVHFDAHADLRDNYLGAKLSHATVMRRCCDIVGGGHIFQFGIRSGDRSEFAFAKKHTYMHKFNFDGLEKVIGQLAGKSVYFTIDLDVLDSSCFSGTGTPEAEGVSFGELRRAIAEVCRLNIVGIDMNELAPNIDQSGASTSLACKLLRETLLSL